MALFYQGSRPVTKGRNSNDSVHPYKGVGVYSNWSLYNTSHVLDGAPNTDHTPGTGRHPHGYQMSRRYTGLDTRYPLENSGNGPELTWWTKLSTLMAMRGEDGQAVFKNGFGHVDRVNSFSLLDPWTYRGVTTRPLNDPGHTYRNVDAAGTANSFGAFAPHIYKGVTPRPLNDSGQLKPEGYDNVGGHNRVNEWRGVPSAKALNI